MVKFLDFLPSFAVHTVALSLGGSAQRLTGSRHYRFKNKKKRPTAGSARPGRPKRPPRCASGVRIGEGGAPPQAEAQAPPSGNRAMERSSSLFSSGALPLCKPWDRFGCRQQSSASCPWGVFQSQEICGSIFDAF